MERQQMCLASKAALALNLDEHDRAFAFSPSIQKHDPMGGWGQKQLQEETLTL